MKQPKSTVYGFFHPYCNTGGGGERVLWQAVYDTLNHDKKCNIVIYTGDIEFAKDKILENVLKRFNIDLDPSRIEFVFLTRRSLVYAKTWPFLTLLGQALGTIILTFEAIWKFKPDIWIDTMGYPFSYPLVSLWLNIPILAYVHFPIISKAMLRKLNPSISSVYGIQQLIKLIYWKIFEFSYAFSGSFVDIVLTNSTWTNNHLKSIWKFNKDIKNLYPPCSTEKFITSKDLNVKKWERKNQIVVLAQFRPEKRYNLIIQEYAKFLKFPNVSSPPKLILNGSIRDKDDEFYVEDLREQAQSLQIPDDQIKFVLDAKYEVLQEYLSNSSYGLNAMWNEHFGIAVVECVASGLVPIVHASAGPYLDIVVPWDSKSKKQVEKSTEDTKTGFYFKDKSDPDFKLNTKKFDDLSEVLLHISKLSNEEKLSITKRGKECVLEKFSDKKFDDAWNLTIDEISQVQNSSKARLFFVPIIVVGVSLFLRFLNTK